MTSLFPDAVPPVTWQVGLIRADVEAVVAGFKQWMGELGRQFKMIRPGPAHDLQQVICRDLAPLSTVRSRTLFLPGGEWVAFLDNHQSGTDTMSVCSQLSRILSVDSCQVTYVPSEDSPYPARIFAMIGPQGVPPLHYVRTVAASNDGGRWVFEQSGEPLKGEDTSTYRARRKKDRFPVDALQALCKSLDLPVFEDSWKLDVDRAVLLRERGVKDVSPEMPSPCR